MSLPHTTVPRARWSQPYSLSLFKRELQPLKADLVAFQAWCTAAQQFDRPGGPLADSTLECVLATLFLYLGFLEHHWGVAEPGFHDLLIAEEIVQFLGFSVDKGRSIDSLRNIISHMRKALIWMVNTKPELQIRVTELLSWLERVQKQLVITIPKRKRDISALEGEGKWVEAEELVVKVAEFERRVREEVGKVPEEEPLGLAHARLLHDCCLAACMFSYLPPLRLVCLRSLYLPVVPGCSKSDCRYHNCQGNRLCYKNDKLHIKLSHYKVDKK